MIQRSIVLFFVLVFPGLVNTFTIKVGHVADDSIVGIAEGKAAFEMANDMLRQNQIISPDIKFK